MGTLAKNRWAWLAAGILAFGAAFALAASRGGPESAAAGLPGTVEQSGSASASGWVIEAVRATFGGTAVDVEVRVRPEDGGSGVAVVSAADAEMDGVRAESARISSDGRSLLRFPPEAWPDGTATTQLSIDAVRVRDSSTRELVRVAGDWQIPVEVPTGSDAASARAVEALPLATANIVGHEVVIEAFRTQSATVVRYELPVSIFAISPPALRADGRTVEATLSQQVDGRSETWYDPTQDASSLTLVFSGLIGPAPDSKHTWKLNLALAPFDPPEFPGTPYLTESPRERDRKLSWERLPGSDGPPVVEVIWHHGFDVRLVISLEGMWDPMLVGGEPPRVSGDGTELTLIASGVDFATDERGARTRITVRLPDPVPPRNLVVISEGAVVEMDPVEVRLLP